MCSPTVSFTKEERQRFMLAYAEETARIGQVLAERAHRAYLLAYAYSGTPSLLSVLQEARYEASTLAVEGLEYACRLQYGREEPPCC